MEEIVYFFMIMLFMIFGDAVSTEVDPKGYVVYCPCMGRFGNQADHFLGALSFARGLDRTLILPPWIEYPRHKIGGSDQIPFDTYFNVEPLQRYHRVITMEKFMKELAPSLWPPGKRISFCYMARHGEGEESCNAKDGNPFGPFWDKFKIDFDKSEFYGPLYYDMHDISTKRKWDEKYPASKFPVLAFTGAPASFPVQASHISLHKYLKWSNSVEDKANEIIEEKLVRPYVGIHLRRGSDWKRACEHVGKSQSSLFASPQCLGYNNEHGIVTKELCFPSDDTIIKQLKKTVKKIKAKSVYVATDSDTMYEEFTKALKSLKVKVVAGINDSPHIDLCLLGKADHYIGNCVSTFSAFAKRERDGNNKPSSFWAFPLKKKHEEL